MAGEGGERGEPDVGYHSGSSTCCRSQFRAASPATGGIVMNRTTLKDFNLARLCLGGNVFGWSADEAASFAVLDAYAAAGGNFIDTADTYSSWVAGHTGGESELIIGRWMTARGNRERMVIATKVGKMPGLDNLAADTIRRAVEGSLRRLQTDRIDLHYAHADDPRTPLPETLGAFDALVREGKVRSVAASNYSAPRLAEALDHARRESLTPFVALQPHYNLVERAAYEGDLQDLCLREGLACFPYFALARGFLTGKYRPGATVESVRSTGASAYLNERGLRVLAELDALAGELNHTHAAIALAWLSARPTVVAPIVSARTVAQVEAWLPALHLRLDAEAMKRLDRASQPETATG